MENLQDPHAAEFTVHSTQHEEWQRKVMLNIYRLTCGGLTVIAAGAAIYNDSQGKEGFAVINIGAALTSVGLAALPELLNRSDKQNVHEPQIKGDPVDKTTQLQPQPEFSGTIYLPETPAYNQ